MVNLSSEIFLLWAVNSSVFNSKHFGGYIICLLLDCTEHSNFVNPNSHNSNNTAYAWTWIFIVTFKWDHEGYWEYTCNPHDILNVSDACLVCEADNRNTCSRYKL